MNIDDIKTKHPRTTKNFATLECAFKPYVLDVLAQLEKLGYQPVIWEGRRTIEEQREKVRLGYSKTMRSRHLSGYAADIVDRRYLWDSGKYMTELRQYAKDIKRIAEDMGIISGTIWKSFGPLGDYAHVELPFKG